MGGPKGGKVGFGALLESYSSAEDISASITGWVQFWWDYCILEEENTRYFGGRTK